jgi:NitT/TauT family transport system substrate-binding protein
MKKLLRFTLLASCLSVLCTLSLAQTKIKLTLNWKYEGPQAWFFLAQEKGYFKAEGLDVEIDQGEGSAASIPKVASGAYQAGFGDINAITDLVSKKPTEAPVAVFMLYNTPPFTLVIKKDSPIKTLKDLEGKTLGAPANDGALKLFPALIKLNGLDASKITITNMAPNLREQMLMRDQIDGAFGYVTTISFSAKAMGLDPEKDIRFIRFGDHGLDLYSNTVFFSRSFAKENPEAVKGFLRALNKAIKEVLAAPAAGVQSVLNKEPLLNKDLELAKLIATLHNDMSHGEVAKLGLGDVDDARLKKSIAIVVESNQLPRTPSVNEVFDHSFLPAKADRPIKLF